MAGEQEVGDALADCVLVTAVGTHKLSLHHLRLYQEAVQVLEGLAVLLAALKELLLCWWLRWQAWEAELEEMIDLQSVMPCLLFRSC